jgi:hypothetical protein
VRPVLSRLAQHLDIRLVQTALDLVQVYNGPRNSDMYIDQDQCTHHDL